jgi:hypothetical protein
VALLLAGKWLAILAASMLSFWSEHFSKRDIVIDLIFLAALVLAWLAPEFGEQIFDPIEKFAARLAQRRVLAILLIALVTILVRVSLLGLLPVPVPQIHDEFSYLLAADTFVHGRLTNPAHPMGVFFETIHVNQQPTYMSKYPPAQGAVLALGQLLGHPWIGVLLSAAASCAAILWMMQGWLPPRWALLGAALVLLRLAIFSYWVNSYWGGAVAAIGGALVVGALPRILKFQRWRDALVLGIGAAILANSRPLEGAILCVPVTFVLLGWLVRCRLRWRRKLQEVALPLGVVSLLCIVFMAYYNWRGTGSPLMFPYVINEKTYVSTPTLFWEKARPPLRYSNPQFEAFYNGWMRAQWIEGRVDSIPQAVKHIKLSGIKVAYFFLWPELCLPLVPLPWILHDRRTRFLIILMGVSFLGFLLVPWTQAHYAAPLAGALFAAVVQGIRHLRQWEYRYRRVGISLSRVLVLFTILLAPLHPHSQAMGNLVPAGIEYRAEFEKQLAGLPGKHLVIVRYLPNHSVLQEWVYNRADIDGAKIAWAREIPGLDIRPLLDYFRGRRVWVAEPDLSPPRLGPYVESR